MQILINKKLNLTFCILTRNSWKGSSKQEALLEVQLESPTIFLFEKKCYCKAFKTYLKLNSLLKL
jgi:hypothetical protein